MSHVLEHMFDPVSYMRRLGYLLNPDGRIIIEVPNGNEACGFEVAHPFIFTTQSLLEIGPLAAVPMIDAVEHTVSKAQQGEPVILARFLRGDPFQLSDRRTSLHYA